MHNHNDRVFVCNSFLHEATWFGLQALENPIPTSFSRSDPAKHVAHACHRTSIFFPVLSWLVVVDFGQFRLRPISTSANFDFGQFRLQPISISASWPKSNWPKSNWPKSSVLVVVVVVLGCLWCFESCPGRLALLFSKVRFCCRDSVCWGWGSRFVLGHAERIVKGW